MQLTDATAIVSVGSKIINGLVDVSPPAPGPLPNNPVAVTPYALISGPLFVGAPKYNDVVQGRLGDCGLMTGLSQAAFRHPDIVQAGIVDNGDGTVNVRIFDNGVPVYITVDKWLPSGYASYVPALWPALAEKAFAIFWDVKYGMAGYDGDTMFIFDTFNKLTGQVSTHYQPPTDEAGFIAAYNAGKMIGFATKSPTTYLVANHAYGVISYDPVVNIVTLWNPWGFLVTATWAQIVADCAYYDYQIKKTVA